MPDTIGPIVDFVVGIGWLEIVKSLAPVATAVIALFALRNWQRQDKAKRAAEFLDALFDSAHTYIIDMRRPIALLEMAKIGMASHVQSRGSSDEPDKIVNGAIAYIEKRGERDGERLFAALKEAEPSTTKLRSLAIKGQIFKFNNYEKCQDAVTMLTWHFDRIQSFASIIESPTWNWDNPEVRGLLTKVMAIEPEDIRKSLSENETAFVKFASAAYERIYR